jgi:hypothetical protein
VPVTSRPRNRADVTLAPDTRSKRRHRLLIGGAVVLVALAIELVIVFPSHVGRSGRQSDFRGFVSSLRADVSGCAYALRDGYHALAKIHDGDTAELPIAKTILSQDEAYCTLAVNSDLYNLATLAPPNDLDRYNLTPVTHDLYAWAFPGAAGILADCEVLLLRPRDARALADIRSRLAVMHTLLSEVNADLTEVSRQLGMPPQTIALNPRAAMPSFLAAELVR